MLVIAVILLLCVALTWARYARMVRARHRGDPPVPARMRVVLTGCLSVAALALIWLQLTQSTVMRALTVSSLQWIPPNSRSMSVQVPTDSHGRQYRVSPGTLLTDGDTCRCAVTTSSLFPAKISHCTQVSSPDL